jgi:hypothetical protein
LCDRPAVPFFRAYQKFCKKIRGVSNVCFLFRNSSNNKLMPMACIRFKNANTKSRCPSNSLRAGAIQKMTGTSDWQRVPLECFDTYFLAVPSCGIANRFSKIAAPLFARIKAQTSRSRTLAAIRDTLPPKLRRAYALQWS